MSALPPHKKSLNAVVATGAGASVDTLGAEATTCTVVASGVTTGGTVKFQGSADGSTWYDIATITVNANGGFSSSTQNAHRYVRANLTARTDGTYTAYITCSGHVPGGWDTS